jgi:orotate phosphoribosyltransferase
MSENEARLLRLLQERAVQRGGPFRLASGQISDYYLDVRQVSVYSAGCDPGQGSFAIER